VKECNGHEGVDYDVLNAVLRGIVSAHGSGGGITGEVIPVRTHLHIVSYEQLVADVVKAVSHAGITDGDVLIITSSVIAHAQGRIVPAGAIPKETGCRDRTPHLMSDTKRQEYARSISVTEQLACSALDVLLSDTALLKGDERILLAPERPNDVAYDIASSLLRARSIRCDVVVKDSDAGTCGGAIIGHSTLVATPLGATKGLSILDAMRVAAAAEVLMGKTNGIPLVLCRPANRVVRERRKCGERRMGSFLDASKEPLSSSHDERL
jgi:F420-0:gamma-glutamyl ligase